MGAFVMIKFMKNDVQTKLRFCRNKEKHARMWLDIYEIRYPAKTLSSEVVAVKLNSKIRLHIQAPLVI